MPHCLSSTELEEIARTSYKAGSFDSALTTIDQAIKVSSRTPVASQLDLRAAIREQLGDSTGALQDAKLLIRKFECDTRGYLRAARVLHRMGKSSNAVLIFERGLSTVPQEAAGYLAMADKHQRLVQLLLPNTRCDPFSHLPLEIVEMCPSLRNVTAEEVLGERRLATWLELPSTLRSLTLRAAAKQGIPYIYLAGILNHSPHLQTLVLSGWGQVHGSPELDFIKQRELRTLHVDAGVLTLLNLPETIKELSINCYLGAPPRPLGAQRLRLPNLERLTCRTMQDVEVLLRDSEGDAGSRLEYLAIPAAELAVDWSESALTSERLDNILELKLYGARRTDGELIPTLLKHNINSLQSLDLSHSDITGVGIRMLVEGCKKLKRLRLACCNDLGVDAVEWARAKGLDVDCFWEKGGLTSSGRTVRYGAY
ncbi:hypothetical protein CAC42_890 [Sphaceloma murrayae]|uniref:Uncharacterized protein n=1 Tax=Sphaceloma murrayae TaxID=2082308 RepID=A0A2K1R2M2_9PEZI|nr:hypothetical protein CAC42_890 [Sphaceloma murrayae]